MPKCPLRAHPSGSKVRLRPILEVRGPEEGQWPTYGLSRGLRGPFSAYPGELKPYLAPVNRDGNYLLSACPGQVKNSSGQVKILEPFLKERQKDFSCCIQACRSDLEPHGKLVTDTPSISLISNFINCRWTLYKKLISILR